MHPTNLPTDRNVSLVDRAAKAHRENSTRPGTRLSRTWNILKYYRTSQLARRLLTVLRQRSGLTRRPDETALDTSIPQVRTQSEFHQLREIRSATCHQANRQVRQALVNGEVCLLNQAHALRWRISDERTLLWQFQLHYHEFLLPLVSSLSQPDHETAEVDLGLIENTIDSWINENPIGRRECHLDAWHPYCISRRLPVWFCLLTIPALDNSLRQRMLRSAHQQAGFLSRHLEWDLRGNHLLENIRAIALAGCFFETEDSKRWMAIVRKTLPQQIREQILSHGEHFERCPMYHCQILGNLLEILIVSRKVDPQIHAMARPSTEKMLEFLVEIVHPDGEIPLLGDSCFGEAPNVSCLEQLAAAAEVECRSTEPQDNGLISQAGPYWIFRDQNDFLIFDRGPAGASTLPAHAHCDLLTLEASINGVRWLVDSGLHNYEDDPMRWYCRSSLAHNVVCVEDHNQFDIWSKFRMGFRGWPSGLANGCSGDFCWATASHNAYRRLGLGRISRVIGVEKRRFWYCLDRAESKTKKTLSGFLHLGCEAEVSRLDESRFLLKIGKTTGELSFFGVRGVKLVEGRYCPEFGIQTHNVVIEYTFSNLATPVAGWLLWLDDHAFSPNHPRANLHVNRLSAADQITISTVSDTVPTPIHTFNWKL